MKKILLVVCFLVAGSGFYEMRSQNVFADRILPIFQNGQCGNAYCHGGSAVPGLSFNGSAQEIYDELVNADPTNAVALAKGEKRVLPGYPERSFLYRKINNGLHNDSNLTIGEGDAMPGGGQLSQTDRELIRQWIYMGAPFDTNTNADADIWMNEANINEFYTIGGIGTTDIPPAPAPEEGFQIKFGPFFLGPGVETEILKTYKPLLEANKEINRIDVFMNEMSHHFIIYKYENVSGQAAGIRELNMNNVISSPLGFGNARFLAIWQESEDFILPEGTAYKMDTNDEMDLNFHLKNYSTTSVLAAEVYVNVYLQDDGTAEKEMYSDLVLYGGSEQGGLGILSLNAPAHQISTIGESFTISDNQQVNLWMLSSHTHKFGKDYDVYLQNPDGTRGVQLFEGWYNSNYTANQGFYDYQDPPIRYFDHFLELPAGTQLYHEAIFDNNTDANVGFGLTTDDEMFITIIQYTRGENTQLPALINELPAQLCADDEPIAIYSDNGSGALGEGIANGFFDPAAAGTGTHTITTNCCGGNMNIISIDVLEAPGELSIIGITDISAEVSGGFDHYQWYYQSLGSNEWIMTDQTSPIVIADVDHLGTYYCEAWNENSCKVQSDMVPLIGEGIEDLYTGTGMVVYPNPIVQGMLQLAYAVKEPTEMEFIITDLSGKTVDSWWEMPQGQINHTTRDINTLQSGIYFIRYASEGHTHTTKLIVQ